MKTEKPRTSHASRLSAASLLRFLALPLLASNLAACNVGSSGEGSSGTGLDSPPLRALTVYEMQNTIADVYGDPATELHVLQPTMVQAGVETIGGPEFDYTSSRADQLEGALGSIATRIVTTGSLASCAAATDNFECLRTSLQTVLPLLHRRPVTPADIDVYVKVATDNAASLGRTRALSYAIEATLLSPETLYLPSVGGEGAAAGEMTQLELASRMSYLIWASGPDLELITAANNGELATEEQIRAQAERLMRHPKSERGMTRFVLAWSAGLDLGSRLKDGAANWDNDFVNDARTETITFIANWWASDEPKTTELFMADSTYVNQRLADYYGFAYPGGDGFKKVSLPADSKRTGLLTQVTFLAATSKTIQSSPTLRGRWVMEKGLCRSMGISPADALSKAPAHVEGEQTRDYHEQLMAIGDCSGCHKQMEPPGFAFEAFDGTGTQRSMESGRPIRDNTTLSIGSDLDGSYATPREFVAAVAKSEDIRYCMSSYFLSYGLGRMTTEKDEELQRGIATQFSVNAKAAMLDLVTSKSFRKANK